jgi:hypothetical protein
MGRYRANQWTDFGASRETDPQLGFYPPPAERRRGSALERLPHLPSVEIDRYFKPARRRRLGDIFDVRIRKQLGCGAFGCAYATDTPYAVKITADEEEGPMWERYRMAQRRHALPGIPKVERVIRLDTTSALRDQVFAILREEAGPLDPWSPPKPWMLDFETAMNDFRYRAYDFYGNVEYDHAAAESDKERLKAISKFVGGLAKETRDLGKTLAKLTDLEIPPPDTHMGNFGTRIHPEFGDVGQILFIDPGVTPVEHMPEIRERFAANAARLGQPDMEEVNMDHEPNAEEHEEVYTFPLTEKEYDALRYLGGKYQSAEILYDNWDDEDQTIPRTAAIASFIATAKDGGDIGVVPAAGSTLRAKIEALYDESGASTYDTAARDFYESEIDDPFLFVEGYEENPEVKRLTEAEMGLLLQKAMEADPNASAGVIEDANGLPLAKRVKGTGSEIAGWALTSHGMRYMDALRDAQRGGVVLRAPQVEYLENRTQCPVGTEVQTLLFDKDDFTKSDAKAWARENDFKHGKVDETDEYYRLRQRPPGEFKKSGFRTIDLSTGVKAVIGCPK